jgi:predicted MFS family arabinose efflux permease
VPETNRSYEIRIVAVLAVLWGLVALNRIGITFLFPFILPEFRMSATQAGVLVSVFAVCFAAAQVCFGGLSDRIGRKRVLVPSALAFGALSLITGTVASAAALFTCWGAAGACGGPTFPPSAATIAEESEPRRRGLNMGIHQSLFPLIGIGFGGIVLTALGSSWGWKPTLMAIGALTFVWGLVVMAVMREPASSMARTDGTEQTEKVRASSVFRYRNVVVSVGVCMCYMTWIFVFSAFCVLYLTQVRNFPIAAAGGIMSAWGFGGFLGMILIPGLSDNLGRQPTTILASLFAGLSVMVFVTSGFGLSGLAAVLFVGGFFGWGAFPLFLSIFPSESVPPSIIGVAISLPASIGDLFGSVVMPILGGLLADSYGLTYTMYLAGAMPLLAAVIALAYRETAPKVLARRRLALQGE